MRWIGRALAAAFALLLAAVVAFLVYRHLALPVTEGRLVAAGLREGLRNERDAHGIPTSAPPRRRTPGSASAS